MNAGPWGELEKGKRRERSVATIIVMSITEKGLIMEPWSVNTLLICFGGGLLGASLGGLLAFVFCALIVLFGSVLVLSGGSDFLLLQVGIGPVFGPHAGGFASGVAAVTYAVAVKKNLAKPVLGLGAKDILSPLMDTSWDVLLVGGITAMVGHGLLQILVKIPVINMFDDIAMSVVLTAFLARLFFFREAPWGRSESIKECGYFGYKCQWIPWMNVPSRQVIFGLAVGLFSGALVYCCKGVLDPMAAAGKITAAGAFVVPLVMSWAIAGVSLIALELGTLTIDLQGEIQKVPVWHCQSILAALAYLYFGNILVAGIVGILATFLQDLMARMFWNHGSNHVDPPAAAIAVGTLILNVVHKFVP